VTSMLAADIAATCAELMADQAADRKAAVEKLGPFNASALELISNLGQRISNPSSDECETQFVFQCISVTIQCFNLVLLHDSFSMDPPDQ